MIRIYALPMDLGGCGFYRVLFPLEMLRERGGHECFLPGWEEGVLEQTDVGRPGRVLGFHFNPSVHNDGDVYVIQRAVDAANEQVVRLMRGQRKKVVFEIDDWYGGVPEGNLVKGRLTKDMKRRLAWLMEHADLVTVSTRALAELYDEYEPKVLGNFLSWKMWEDVQPQYELERERVRIGWMGDSLWHGGDIEVIRKVIGPWLRKHPEVDFVSAGDSRGVLHDLLGVPEGQRVSYGGVDFGPELVGITATMDIGLVPLELNDFNEAKSALKGMEYAACGIPCIASPTAEYRAWVGKSPCGFIAATKKDWGRHLDALLDPTLRATMGQNARKQASEHTIEQHWPQWEDTYEALLGARVAA